MGERLLTFAEAAERLTVPQSWLREKVARRQVPHTRLGKHVRFTEGDLEEIVRRGHQAPLPQVGSSARRLPRR